MERGGRIKIGANSKSTPNTVVPKWDHHSSQPQIHSGFFTMLTANLATYFLSTGGRLHISQAASVLKSVLFLVL